VICNTCAHITAGGVSYHFDSEDHCYLSFGENSDIKFANGNALPAEKRLIDMSYDASCRTFRGTLDWGSDTIGDTGVSKEVYEFIFADDFSTFSGTVKKFNDRDVEVVRDLVVWMDQWTQPHDMVCLRLSSSAANCCL